MGVLGLFNFAPSFWVFGLMGVMCAIFWIVQFVMLMGMPDSAFPGKYDKVVWGLAMVVLTVVAAVAFREWRYGMERKRKAEEFARARANVRVVG